MFNETQNIVSRPVRVILIIVPAFLLDSSRCQHFVSQSCFIFFEGGGGCQKFIGFREEWTLQIFRP